MIGSTGNNSICISNSSSCMNSSSNVSSTGNDSCDLDAVDVKVLRELLPLSKKRSQLLDQFLRESESS